uniref:Uncharacterized protein n=2 Tax=Schistocephalus solidus TaxID=70667 RepID=A0A0X3QAH1_SCHSO
MMQGDEWFPELPGVQFIRKIVLTPHFLETRILRFNTGIKEIILHGKIKHFSDHEPESVLQVLRPYDESNEHQRKLMRVTGRMEIEYQSFTLTGGPMGDEKYVLMPSEITTIQKTVVDVFDWPEGYNRGGK